MNKMITWVMNMRIIIQKMILILIKFVKNLHENNDDHLVCECDDYLDCGCDYHKGDTYNDHLNSEFGN